MKKKQENTTLAQQESEKIKNKQTMVMGTAPCDSG
jgi:hypothetical protein